MIAPKDESRDLVMQWLEVEGLAGELSPRGDAVIIKAPVKKIEKLLSAEYIPFSKFACLRPPNINCTPKPRVISHLNEVTFCDLVLSLYLTNILDSSVKFWRNCNSHASV